MATFSERIKREERLRPIIPLQAALHANVKVWGYVRHISDRISRRVEQVHTSGRLAVVLEGDVYLTAAEFDAAGYILMEEVKG